MGGGRNRKEGIAGELSEIGIEEPNRETSASAGVKYGKPCAVKREREREKQAKHSTRLLV